MYAMKDALSAVATAWDVLMPPLEACAVEYERWRRACTCVGDARRRGRGDNRRTASITLSERTQDINYRVVYDRRKKQLRKYEFALKVQLTCKPVAQAGSFE